MTREEAAKILYNQWQGFLEDNIDYAGISDAYKMAFKALEQEPCEDIISRQVVLDYIRDNYRRWFINDDAFMQCVNGVKDIVPVTAQAKVGKWIKSSIGGAKVCSICQAHMGLSNFKYCPNCGAKMESGDEE